MIIPIVILKYVTYSIILRLRCTKTTKIILYKGVPLDKIVRTKIIPDIDAVTSVIINEIIIDAKIFGVTEKYPFSGVIVYIIVSYIYRIGIPDLYPIITLKSK